MQLISYNVHAEPLINIATGLHNIAIAIRDLGTGNATTDMGAIELLSKEIKDGSELLSNTVASSIGHLAYDIVETIRNK